MDTNQSFLVYLEIKGQGYILLTQNENGDWCIGAAKTIEDGLEKFKNLKEGVFSKDFADFLSAAISLASLNPHILGIPTDQPELLKEYVQGMHPVKTQGIVGNNLLNIVGAPVSQDILKLSVCDVANAFMKEADEAKGAEGAEEQEGKEAGTEQDHGTIVMTIGGESAPQSAEPATENAEAPAAEAAEPVEAPAAVAEETNSPS